MSEHHSEDEKLKNKLNETLQTVLSRLISPGNVMIQMNGSKNVITVFESFQKTFHKIYRNVSGISFEVEALSQLASYNTSIKKLKKNVLIGCTFKTKIFKYEFNNHQMVDLLEGFDDLERKLATLKAWGGSFVILQIDVLMNNVFLAKNIPFDNAHFIGIFAASVQSRGMIPIIQFKYDLLRYTEQDCSNFFNQLMFRITKALFEFDVKFEYLMVSQSKRFPEKTQNYNIRKSSEIFIQGLQNALPPCLGGVILCSEGSVKALSLAIDTIDKIVERKPWTITCGFNYRIPDLLEEEEVVSNWISKHALIIELLSRAQKGELIDWKPKPSGISPEFIKSHDYYDPYIESELFY